MASRHMDPVSSFQHLVDHIPTWQSQVADLTKYATERYEGYVAEYARLLHQVKVKKQKSASIASAHESDNEKPIPGQTEPQSTSPQLSEPIEPNPLEAGNRCIYTQVHQKRKPDTSLRSNASRPRVFRSKKMVIIYYDSHIQMELDKLVKAFGAARNNLRKGKLSYNAAKGFKLPALSRRYENLGPNSLSKSAPRLTKTSSDSSSSSATEVAGGEAAFAKLDKEIEQVQTLCETAAHQVIREGDIQAELSESARKLEVIFAMAQSALEMLKAEKQKISEDEAQAENVPLSETTSTQSTLCEKSRIGVIGTTHKTLPPLTVSLESSKRPPLSAANSAPVAPLLTDAIEVDDNEEEGSSIDIDLNITNYRAANRRVAA